jgi:hypothetical protein
MIHHYTVTRRIQPVETDQLSDQKHQANQASHMQVCLVSKAGINIPFMFS